MKKVLARIGTLLLVMAMTLAIIPGAAFAEGGNSITLTKYSGTTGQPSESGGNGNNQEQPTGTTALKNVEFKLYSTGITAASYTGVPFTEGTVSGADTTGTLPDGWGLEKTTSTDNNGVINWTGLEDGLYYVVETAKSTVTEKTKSFYVMLPFTYPESEGTTLAGTTTHHVYVYPKNVLATPAITVNKVSSGNAEAAKGDTSYEVAASGETINWTSTLALPTTTPDVQSLVITDTQADGLTAVAAATVKVGNTTFTAGTDYTFAATDNDFTITFTPAGITALKTAYAAAEPKNMTVTYSSALPAESVSGTNYSNTLKATFVDENTTQTVEDTDFANVTTGKVTVTKTDKNGAALAGVTFTLTGPNGFTAVSKVTGTDGKATFDGLGDGEYTVQETATVPGYSLNPTAKTFTVAATANAADFATIQYTFELKNYQSPLLPLTGGTGIAMIAIIGVALIGGAIVLMKKKNMAK